MDLDGEYRTTWVPADREPLRPAGSPRKNRSDTARDANLKTWGLANRLFQLRPREQVIQIRLQEIHLRFVCC